MNKLIDYHLYHKPMDIKNVLAGVASQENCDGPEYDLMMEAAEYIRLLETLLDLSNQVIEMNETSRQLQTYSVNIPSRCIDGWKELANNQKNIAPEFIKIVEDNFWELLA